MVVASNDPVRKPFNILSPFQVARLTLVGRAGLQSVGVVCGTGGSPMKALAAARPICVAQPSK
jgi:hypothetical protein